MNRFGRRGLAVALVAAVLLLVGSVAVFAVVLSGVGPGRSSPTGVSRALDPDGDGYGPGMMGGGSGAGMMRDFGSGGSWQGDGRFGVAGDGRAVTSMAAAATRAQVLADRIGGLHVGEVMQFSNGFYAELLTTDGSGATEVLVDPDTGAVSIEPGPATMWNTEYGMRAAGRVSGTVSAAQAGADAQVWLDAQTGDLHGLTAGPAEAFPGYYTLHTLRDGTVVGMMSVNASTGAIWYHTWHGGFVAMTGE